LMRQCGVGLHVHVAEDRCDVQDARSKYGQGIVERLARYGALNQQTILAHGVYLETDEIKLARDAGVWFAHNPRSNMNNQVGYAPVKKFGKRVVLGTDGIGADMFEEAHFAFFKGRDARADLGADDWLAVLANGQQMASEAFGIDLQKLSTGSAADLIVLDYSSPTPLRPENLAWHLVFGLNSGTVESVMVNGQFVINNRRSTIDDRHVRDQASRASEKLWARLKEI
jgi:cytosine/adenosine deaminase-related metal-dependent hydrolase